MLCPHCGARNPLGAQRCRECRHAFTRAALAADGPPVAYAVAPERAPRRRARRGGCLTALAALALVVVAGLVAALALSSFVVKPLVRGAAGDDIRQGVRVEVASQLSTQVGGLPDGRVTVTDDDVNQRIAQVGDLGPLDDVRVGFTPAGIVVRLSAYGLSGDYTATPRVVDGSVQLAGGAIGGALGYVVPAGDLEQIVNEQIAAALAGAGYTVRDIALGDGQMVLTVTRNAG